MIILHADSNHPTLIKQLEAAGHTNIEAYDQSREQILEAARLIRDHLFPHDVLTTVAEDHVKNEGVPQRR